MTEAMQDPRDRLESMVSFRCFDDILDDVNSILALHSEYSDRSHYIRVALIKLNREHMERGVE